MSLAIKLDEQIGAGMLCALGSGILVGGASLLVPEGDVITEIMPYYYCAVLNYGLNVMALAGTSTKSLKDHVGMYFVSPLFATLTASSIAYTTALGLENMF